MKKLHHVVISGGGSGLGLGMAQRYLTRGARVTVLDLNLNQERQQLLANAALKGNSTWQFLKVDVTNSEQVQTVVAKAIELNGAIDLAINSAGIILNKTIADMKAEEFSRVINVNLNGSFNFAHGVLPHLQKGARLALVASLAGFTSNYAYSAYGASKFGVVGLATTLRFEYEVKGVHISCICPPEVNTPMVDTERKEGNPISLQLKKIAGSMDPDDACDQIVAGLDAGRWMIIPSASGKATAWAARHIPDTFHGLMSFLIRRAVLKG